MSENNLKSASIAIGAAGVVAATADGARNDAVKELLVGIKDTSDTVRTEAWLNAGQAGAEAVKPLTEVMTGDDLEVARAAKRALWKIVRHAGRPRAVKEKRAVEAELVKLLGKDQPVPVRREVIWMLSEIGARNSVKFIAKLITNKALREDARMALKRIPNKCDRIQIDKEGVEGVRFVGNFIDVDGVLYRPEIARDGAFIKLTKAENVQTGEVRVPEGITQFSAGGENGLFLLRPEKGVTSLPVGEYRVNEWMLERKDEQDTPWRLKGTYPSGNGQRFNVAVDTAAEFSIGEPVVSTLRASSRRGTYSFRYDMKGRDGERLELTRNGARPRAPKLHIKSKDGSYDRTYSFQYG